ncbi:MAG TPA: methionine biosynthesis protein MetW [Caulobacterales bacterium]|nr:methionine biosynthesis protein MetW [Caulobacterales bacterium]
MTLTLVQPEAIAQNTRARVRTDHAVIAGMVRNGAKVLDVGCGDGALLHLLARERGVKGRGMELSQAGVNACVAKGLSVVQGDADRDLSDYPNDSFDYVILSKTIQAVRHPRSVLKELARIGERVVVSFPNFGHWRVRTQLLASGRMPNTASLPNRWCETENLHLCTVRDFADLARELHLDLERAVPISGGQAGAPFAATLWRANWFAEEAVFLLARR